jgi:hypothetical protein
MPGGISYQDQSKRQTAELLKLIPDLLAEATTLKEKLSVLNLQNKMTKSLTTKKGKRSKKRSQFVE